MLQRPPSELRQAAQQERRRRYRERECNSRQELGAAIATSLRISARV
jgi:hypothetical protein